MEGNAQEQKKQMTPLSNHQKQLLFDYCIGSSSEEEIAEARQLISCNEEAAEIYSTLKTSLSPLDSLPVEPCPDDLAEQTVWRLNNLARSSHLRLEELIAAEQTKQTDAKRGFWFGFRQRLATAAVFMIVGTVLLIAYNAFNSVTNFARQKSWQQMCQMQMSNIWRGVNEYSGDHNGKMPAVATAAGSPWWKVGYQGQENHSNTRPVWLLVKSNYVDPAEFVCSGTTQGKRIKFNIPQLNSYNDFPCRKYVNYSFRITCGKGEKESALSPRILMSDSNPIFEKLPEDFSKPFKLQPTRNSLTSNSINHNCRGQNVLFCDGSIKFVKTRHTGLSEDDIFTLQNTQIYQGCEVPFRETDIFLAP